MPKVSISEASRLVGKPRSTLHRHILKGTLSKEKDGMGKPVVDVAELERVYGSLKVDRVQSDAMPQPAPPNTVAADRGELIAVLQQEIAHLKQTTEDFRQQRDQWQQQADKWQQQATSLLMDQRKPSGFWSRLFSR